MKKTIVVLAVMALAAAGCQKKEEAPKVEAPHSEMPAQMPAGGNPHAGLKPVEIPAGVGHKGKVVETMNA